MGPTHLPRIRRVEERPAESDQRVELTPGDGRDLLGRVRRSCHYRCATQIPGFPEHAKLLESFYGGWGYSISTKGIAVVAVWGLLRV